MHVVLHIDERLQPGASREKEVSKEREENERRAQWGKEGKRG